MSNLRQVGIAIHAYAGDYDNSIPIGPKAQVPRSNGEKAPIFCWRYLSAGLELTFFRGRLVRAKFYAMPKEESCNAVLAIEGKKVGQLTIGRGAKRIIDLFDHY